MTHEEILAKKQSRLAKHDGRSLRRKVKAYRKAVHRFRKGPPGKVEVITANGQCRKEFLRLLSSDDPLEDSIFAGDPEAYVPKSLVQASSSLGELAPVAPVVKAKVQGKKTWLVQVPGKASFTVQSSNEKNARAEARTVLGVRALPNGTTVSHS